ncbi:hypothetical protein WR25_14887 [Diploscapter pachys]|uniref:Uncharacterized protein n=1 Tax=Diploscapter pachys TaxID=2018661 RepID=A0A2A2LVR2_9BILA|nr:hypothetical protein WR25_14887 [Diploscapter pachys]
MDGKQRSIASSSLMTEEGLYNNGEETVEPVVIIREDRLNALNELGKTRMRQNRERTQRELRAQSHMIGQETIIQGRKAEGKGMRKLDRTQIQTRAGRDYESLPEKRNPL